MEQLAPHTAAVQLEGRVDVQSFDEARRLLRDSLMAGSAVVIDLSAVEGFDLIGIQLLIAARRSATEAGKEFRIIGDLAALHTACATYAISLESVGL